MRVGSGATPGAVAGLSLIGLAAIGGWDDARAQAEPESTEPGGGIGNILRQTAYIKASNTGFGDEFGGGGTLLGNAVALSADGTTLAIGAPYESSGSSGIGGNQDDESVYGAGAVYVFTSDGADWRQQAYVKASNPGLTDNFGYMIALSGDGNTMAVSGALRSQRGNGASPAIRTMIPFRRRGRCTSLAAAAKPGCSKPISRLRIPGRPVSATNLSDGDQFGFALALSADGNTLAVGAISEDSAASGVGADQSDNSALVRRCGLCVLARGRHLDTAGVRQAVELGWGAICSAIASR